MECQLESERVSPSADVKRHPFELTLLWIWEMIATDSHIRHAALTDQRFFALLGQASRAVIQAPIPEVECAVEDVIDRFTLIQESAFQMHGVLLCNQLQGDIDNA